MKKSYHVYASAKPGIDPVDFEGRMKLFLDSQLADHFLSGYRIIRYDSTADRGGMSEYQIICDYASEAEMKKGFNGMRPDRWKQDPHAGMMEMVGEFRVAFSEDV
jgi:hypothetical protein